jgi:hypothetical protein
VRAKLIADIGSDKRPALPSGMHPALKSIVECRWKADPTQRPTMAEICGIVGSHLARVE